MTFTYDKTIRGYADHEYTYRVERDEDGTMRLLFPDWPVHYPYAAWKAWRCEIANCLEEIVVGSDSLYLPSDEYSADTETLRDDLAHIMHWSRALTSLLDAEPPHVRPELATRKEQTR